MFLRLEILHIYSYCVDKSIVEFVRILWIADTQCYNNNPLLSIVALGGI